MAFGFGEATVYRQAVTRSPADWRIRSTPAQTGSTFPSSRQLGPLDVAFENGAPEPRDQPLSNVHEPFVKGGLHRLQIVCVVGLGPREDGGAVGRLDRHQGQIIAQPEGILARDIDKRAPRTFRMDRVSRPRLLPEVRFHPDMDVIQAQLAPSDRWRPLTGTWAA